MHTLQALHRSGFKPRSLLVNQRAYDFVLRCGWALIVVRWLYYSILFRLIRRTSLVPPPFESTWCLVLATMTKPTGGPERVDLRNVSE